MIFSKVWARPEDSRQRPLSTSLFNLSVIAPHRQLPSMGCEMTMVVSFLVSSASLLMVEVVEVVVE